MLKLASCSVLALATFAGLAIAGAPAAPAPQPATGGVLGRLVSEKAPAIVSIKFLLKGEEGEQDEETTGTMIEGSGLVIASNTAFGGLAARLGGGSAPTPTDIKVLVGDDTQGVKAKFLARDTELGLAWIQIEEAPAKPYTFINFGDSADSNVGEKIYSVALMGKYFDRAPMVSEGFVTAVVAKPRKLIMPSVAIAAGGEHGLPLFNESGKVVGISTLILPDKDEMEGMKREAMKGFMGLMVLPAKDVVAATAKAKDVAKNAPAESDKKDDAKKEEPKRDPAMDTPK